MSSEFDALLEEYLGNEDVLSDQRVVVRRLYFYDFIGYPTRMWQGQGKLFTADGAEWLGTIDANGRDIHVVPRLQDGRDGSSPAYQFSMTLPDLPDEPAGDLYRALKADQGLAAGRELIVYLAIFKDGEALRPVTPIKFFKRLTMRTPHFSEGGVTQDAAGRLVRTYRVMVPAKDANFGRSNTPNRTLNDATQREYARQLGVTTVDRGLEYIAALANRTYQVP